MSTNCASCVESFAFFQKLREKTFGSPDSPRIIAFFPEPEKEVENYMRERHQTLETQPDINLKALNMLGTLTIVLVNN